MNEVITIILGGGRGTRLQPLTRYRAKPAVPIGGKYRLIDVALSNCVHSGCYRVFVLTQFMSVSLNRHVNNAFAFDRLRKGFVDVIPATQNESADNHWFQGTADAVRKSMLHFREHDFKHYMILSGDHLYRMDYRKMFNQHLKNAADVTVATVPVPASRISEFGIMKTDHHERIRGFIEKPKDVKLVEGFEVHKGMGENGGAHYLASMGIYLFRRETLEGLLENSEENDFGYNIVPRAIGETRTFAYRFDGYWEDIGKIEDFYRANIELTNPDPAFSFYDPQHPIFTRPRTLPGSVVTGSELNNTILTEGCIINNAQIQSSIIGIRSVIGAGSRISNTLMMGADYFEGEEYYNRSSNHRDLPLLGIGPGCSIENAIIDKNARIGRNVTIIPKNPDTSDRGDGYIIQSGITVVEKNAVIPDGKTI